MKLYKKAAACLLTAAMAISMLTACGGGGNGGNGGGNTPGTLPDNSGQIVLPDIDEGEGGGGEGTETKPTKTPIADVNSSKLAEFKEKYAGTTEFYFEVQTVEYDEDGSAGGSTDVCVAVKGNKAHTKMILSGKNQKQQLIEELMLKEFDYNNSYRLLRGSKVAVRTSSYKSHSNDNLSLGTLITDKLPNQMWSTKVKVGPTEYYAEVYKTDYRECTVCFTKDGKPVYQFERRLSTKQLESATLYKTIQVGSGTSKGLCALPTGTKTYSFDDNTGTLIDANGNKFTLQEDATTGIKVLDQTGKDVTDDFKWLTDFFEMMS